MTDIERQRFLELVRQQCAECSSEIEQLETITRPVSPDNAIGRISRMDAINNRAINESRLNAAKEKLFRLEQVLNKGENELGRCDYCMQPIATNRLMALPESTVCIHCAH